MRVAGGVIEKMQELQKSLWELRTENHQDKYFVPQQSLYDLMTPDAVLKVLTECNVAHHHIQETVDAIVPGACKIFAILVINNEVNFITRFIEHDQLQPSLLDQRLPFTQDQLCGILTGVHIISIKKFLEKQWEFTAPVFSGKLIARRLHKKTIIPFIDDEKIAAGGFGVVYRIKLHDQHCKFEQVPTHALVRKEFEASKGDFQLELETLAMLKYLKHPNIIELLGSYTHDSKHNLIFPRASGGDLAELLKKNCPGQFASSGSFLVALAELSSAISAVHNFAADIPELAKSGCHHDIKPRNILVDDARFVLADFGLSRFKSPEKSSETPYKIGEGYYVAPECQDTEAPFLKHTVRRSSDIWSFGCIIAEVLTYMMKGAEGVKTFLEKRWFKVGQWKFCYFHSGDKPNTGVIDWLSHLELEASQSSSNMDSKSCKMLLQLVRRMLAMIPDDRPKAAQVEVTLCFIALNAKAEKIAELYNNASNIHSNSIEAYIEQKTFQSWRWVLGMIDINSNTSTPYQTKTTSFIGSFPHTLKCLGDTENTLSDVLSQEQSPRSRIFLPLRQLNQSLLDQLPQNIKDKADSYLQLQILESEDAAHLEDIRDTLQHIPTNKRLGILAAIKRMTILTKDHPTLSLPQLEPKPSIDVSDQHEKITGRLVKSSSGGEQRVLVERKYYEGHWEKHGPELLDRVAGIAQLLGSNEVSEDLRVLRCSGFYHAQDSHALNLVFEFPASESVLYPLTLRKLFDNNLEPRRSDNEEKPVLGDRFKLAYKLATSVLEFHKVGWLHKSISAFNVVFFASNHSARFDFLEKPYIVNFVHSRPNEEDVFTEGPQEEYLDYQHPAYLSDRERRFRPEFDYYSVGMVLLELGLWKSITEMTKSEGWRGINREIFRDRLIKRRVPQLGPSMGTRYRDAVNCCLRWNPTESLDHAGKTTETSIRASLDFRELVVEPLAQCSA